MPFFNTNPLNIRKNDATQVQSQPGQQYQEENSSKAATRLSTKERAARNPSVQEALTRAEAEIAVHRALADMAVSGRQTPPLSQHPAFRYNRVPVSGSGLRPAYRSRNRNSPTRPVVNTQAPRIRDHQCDPIVAEATVVDTIPPGRVHPTGRVLPQSRPVGSAQAAHEETAVIRKSSARVHFADENSFHSPRSRNTSSNAGRKTCIPGKSTAQAHQSIAESPRILERVGDAGLDAVLVHPLPNRPSNLTDIATFTGNARLTPAASARTILLDEPLYTVDRIRSSLQVLFALPRKEPFPSVVKETHSLSRTNPREIIVDFLDRDDKVIARGSLTVPESHKMQATVKNYLTGRSKYLEFYFDATFR